MYTLQRNPNLYRMWDVTQVVEYYASDPDGCFVAELNDKIVGFLLSDVADKHKSKRFYGYLEWLAVHPYHQGKDPASRLSDRFLKYMRALKVPMLPVDVEASNDKALSFSLDKGFSRPTSRIDLTMDKEKKDDRSYQSATSAASAYRMAGHFQSVREKESEVVDVMEENPGGTALN